MSGWDQLDEEAREKLTGWPKQAQGLFKELLEDAASDLQRELLSRALAAGHSPNEVHAFADELRGMSDDEAFESCTIDVDTGGDYTVAQLLRAESDPLYAFELKGGEISPADDEPSRPDGEAIDLDSSQDFYQPRPEPGQKPSPKGFDTGPDPALLLKHKPVTFESEVSDSRARRMDLHDLGVSTGAAPARPKPVSSNPPSGPHLAVHGNAPSGAFNTRFFEDLLNEASRGLGVTFKEQDVDGDAALKLEAALATASTALLRGVPVPIILGPAPGQHRRFAMLLQLQIQGKTRAWQLYDPFSDELVWANEGDLLARTELPFADKYNRRITRIALPSTRPTHF